MAGHGDFISEVFLQRYQTNRAVSKLLEVVSSERKKSTQNRSRIRQSVITAVFHCLELAQGIVSGEVDMNVPDRVNVDDLHFQLAELKNGLKGFPNTHSHPAFQGKSNFRKTGTSQEHSKKSTKRKVENDLEKDALFLELEKKLASLEEGDEISDAVKENTAISAESSPTKKAKLDDSPSPSKPLTEALSCEFCNGEFPNSESLSEHIINVH